MSFIPFSETQAGQGTPMDDPEGMAHRIDPDLQPMEA